MNDVERQGRIDLAAAFRWAARLGYHESIANHFTLAVTDDGSRFLVNPWGLHFSEIRARDLLLVDGEGHVYAGDAKPERSAICIHAPMHARLPHARCVLHTHMPYATVLTTIEGGRLEMVHQSSARFYGQIAYDDSFNTMALGDDEGDRICRALGDKSILFMANHGVTMVGPTVAEVFDALYYLERACEHQVRAMLTGRALKPMSDEAARKTAEQWSHGAWSATEHFAALKRILDREEPDYAQ
ncbi:MAG: aldolase [Acidiferrobacterales bacterium]